jgi:IS5 family transposase
MWTYKELEFHLADSQSGRAFVRLSYGIYYSDSTLQENIKKISSQTWEKINRILIKYAAENKLEKGRTVRVDSTVVETNIHKPTDSSLIFDCIRVLSKLVGNLKALNQDTKIIIPRLKFSSQLAKNMTISILNAKNQEKREEIYKELIVRAGDNFYQIDTYIQIAKSIGEDNTILKIIAELEHIKDYFEPILAQTIARIVDHESVPAPEKIISLFEEHSDVIVKSRREVEFGHKIFFTTGKSNLILDCQIALGNPSDSNKFMDLIKIQNEIFGRVPRQVSADGGFASQENVINAQVNGVKDVCFAKRCGLSILDMVKSSWVYNKLKKFRAGIESNISALKRGFGLDRANWKGLLGYKSYIWSAVVACNLTILANKL